MKYPISTTLALSFLSISYLVSAAPTLYICSDSTTANYASGALQGYVLSLLHLHTNKFRWGYYISQYLSISVSNQARNGRSTRSFINEGLWTTLLSSVVQGDFVLIEMGHNDDGDPTTDEDDRATLPGIANNSVTVTTSTGATETVYSFGWYLRKMIVDVKNKGGVPLLSGMVNRNYWTGETLRSDWPFADYAEEV